MRAASLACVAALGALPATASIAPEPPAPAMSSPSPLVRKDRLDPSPSEGQVATLATLVNLHTDELLPLSEDEPSPERFSFFVEDRGMRARTEMDACLLAGLRALAHRNEGMRIEIVSGYRSAKRNEMMRKKGHHVASHSQHTLGKAIDLRVEGKVPGEIVKDLEALGWKGGIGRYDGSGDRFVHMDCGPDRRWRGL
jgi:hypothetical protein